MPLHSIIFKSTENDEWYLRVESSNGEIILSSEGHKNRADVEHVARQLNVPAFVAKADGERVVLDGE